MSLFTICPCCSHTLLHHLSHHREYWFCRNCWQEMPDLEAFKDKTFHRQTQITNLSYGLPKLKEVVAV
jgi:hypothetical protein